MRSLLPRASPCIAPCPLDRRISLLVICLFPRKVMLCYVCSPCALEFPGSGPLEQIDRFCGGQAVHHCLCCRAAARCQLYLNSAFFFPLPIFKKNKKKF